MVYGPSQEFFYKVTAIFNGMMQALAQNGQIIGPVQAFLVNEWTREATNIVQQIWNKHNIGQTNTMVPDNVIQADLTNFINAGYRNFQASQQAMMARPVYGQPQQYNYAMANGGMPVGGQSLFTPAQAPLVTPNNVYASTGIATPNQQLMGTPQPVYSGIATPNNAPRAQAPQQPVAQVQQPTMVDTIKQSTVGQIRYEAPVYLKDDPNGIEGDTIKNAWCSGKVVHYVDPKNNEEIDLITVDTDRGFTSPRQAIDAILRTIRNVNRYHYFSVQYGQIVAFDVPRAEGLEAITRLKELVEKVPHNSKTSYIINVIKYLDGLKRGIADAIETQLLTRVNSATRAGALFDSDRVFDQCIFQINSLKDLYTFLSSDCEDERIAKLKTLPGFRDRMNEVARQSILNVIRDIEVVDPNTPSGLDDCLTLYDTAVVDQYQFRDIRKYQQAASQITANGKKTADAEKATAILEKIYAQLDKVTVVKIANQSVAYTTLRLPGMVYEDGNGITGISVGPTLIGGDAPPDSHCEHFAITVSCADGRPFHLFIKPTGNVLMGYQVVRTTDNYFRMVPFNI